MGVDLPGRGSEVGTGPTRQGRGDMGGIKLARATRGNGASLLPE
jgi:hypothetical protein